uniref:Uncharacterized protein n=1 Tax=Trypanosoma congolense (strain IL3000) TaxID=1068625 RepID=G0UP59_TRYCI|nr:conserved hypothetical protein [Trypanosoma congolense IL3000]
MGVVLGLLNSLRSGYARAPSRTREKRLRSPTAAHDRGGGFFEVEGDNTVEVRGPVPAGSGELQSLLTMQIVDGNGALGTPLCHSALCGPSVEGTYGCHYHLYPTPFPQDTHGTYLCWSLRKSPIKCHELVCLCRLANSCRKDMVLVDGDVGLALFFRATL